MNQIEIAGARMLIIVSKVLLSIEASSVRFPVSPSGEQQGSDGLQVHLLFVFSFGFTE